MVSRRENRSGRSAAGMEERMGDGSPAQPQSQEKQAGIAALGGHGLGQSDPVGSRFQPAGHSAVGTPSAIEYLHSYFQRNAYVDRKEIRIQAILERLSEVGTQSGVEVKREGTIGGRFRDGAPD